MRHDTPPSRTHCDFSCNGEKICETMDKAGVPARGRWRTLVLYMRGMQEYEQLAEDQKARIQSLLINTLRRKDYSDESYESLIQQKNDILNQSNRMYLQAALQKTERLVQEFGDLMIQRRKDVKRLGDETVTLIETEGGDSASIIEKIRDSFNDVVEAMDQDARLLQEMTRTDPLTNIANRRAFDEVLAEAARAWTEQGTPFSLIMLDIDHFKRFNDTYGHRIGDQALITVAALLKEAGKSFAKENDCTFIPARYGGEEFAVILPGVVQNDAMDAAEDVLAKVRAYNFVIRDADGGVIERGIRLTLSAGVAEVLPEWNGNFTDRIVDAADKAMYSAKRQGRDRVRLYVEGGF